LSNYTCLLIDDSMIQARVISQMIMRIGWVALVALDLRAGLAVLAEEPVELVISDLTLPDSTGGSTIAKIRHAAPEVTIAAIGSGGGRDSASMLLERAKADGAEFLLQKPFSHERRTPDLCAKWHGAGSIGLSGSGSPLGLNRAHLAPNRDHHASHNQGGT
jgi:CheY-like chemotaxis protein